MRFAFLTSTPLSAPEGSGTFVGIDTLAAGLRGAGHEVRVRPLALRTGFHTLDRYLYNVAVRLSPPAADIVVERLTALGPQQLGVIGNTRSLRVARSQRDPRAIRRETGAGYFVFGQVQDDDAGVRLVVHLIRLDDDTHLWVTRVARSQADLADIQDVVADRLAEAVRRHVIERDPSAPRFTR